MSKPTNQIQVNELDTELIPPLSSRFEDPAYNGGCKLVVVGKPGTGKSTLIKALLYSKKHIFPIAMAMSGSEDSNHAYKEFLPNTFIFNEYNEEKIKERTEDGIQDFDSGETSDYTLKRSFKISSSEVMERFGLIESTINEILGGKNIEKYYDIDDAFRDCGLSIEELREKRKIDSEKLKADEKIDSEPFDAEKIISKITSGYALTPKRKEALIESIRMLK